MPTKKNRKMQKLQYDVPLIPIVSKANKGPKEKRRQYVVEPTPAQRVIGVKASGGSNLQRSNSMKKAQNQGIRATKSGFSTLTGPKTIAPTERYLLSLMDPFRRDALGVQLSGPYESQKTTYKVQTLSQLTTTATGTINASFLGNPYETMVIRSGTCNTSGLYNYPLNSRWWAALYYPTLYTQVTTIRLVATAIKIRCTMPPLTCKGRLIVAKSGGGGFLIPPSIMESVSLNTDMMYQRLTGFQSTPTTSLLELDDCYSIDLNELLGRELLIPLLPNSADHTAFHQVYSANLNLTATDYEECGATHLGNFHDPVDSWKPFGFESVHIALSGCDASADCISVEHVFHLEGDPTVTATTPGTMVPSAVYQVGNNAIDPSPLIGVARTKEPFKLMDIAKDIISFGKEVSDVTKAVWAVAGPFIKAGLA